MLRKIAIVAVLQILLVNAGLAAEEALPKSFISFSEAERLAIENSPTIASQRYMVQSANQDAAAQRVRRFPDLSFEASSQFQSKIGRINFPALGINRHVGEHINWSVGPALEWVVWDTGEITNKAKSLEKIADSQNEILDYSSRQVLLNVRMAYVGVQLAKEQVKLVGDALRVARSQYADVSEKKKVGTADLLDLTVAHQEMVDRQRDLEKAQGELAISRRTLVATLGYDPDVQAADSLDVEPIGKVLKTLLPRADAYVDIEEHPQVRALSDQQAASQLAAKSSSARHWPTINLRGTATFEYPNLGEDKVIQQNRLLLGLQFPILDWGMISKESRSYRYQANSALEQKKQTTIDLSRNTAEIRERIKTLKVLRIANARAVRDAVKVARLSYDSYQAGRIIFLDVQRANVKALAVQVDSAQTDAELAMQISRLLALAEGEGSLDD